MSLRKLKPVTKHKFQSVLSLFSTPRRWMQHAMKSSDGTKCCLLGAVNQVYKSPSARSRVKGRLEIAISQFNTVFPTKSSGSNSVVGFNDQYQRKFEDVRWVAKRAGV